MEFYTELMREFYKLVEVGGSILKMRMQPASINNSVAVEMCHKNNDLISKEKAALLFQEYDICKFIVWVFQKLNELADIFWCNE